MSKSSYNIQSLTISIPAYNDGKSLVKLVNESQNLCKELNLPLEILIINDGSSDDTLKVAQGLASIFGNIQVIHHEKNLGFGETLKKVFMTPKTEWVLFLPGDNQFPVSNLAKLLEIKDSFDYILGYRKDRKDALHRKLFSLLYNRLVSLLSGFEVRDVNSIVFYRSQLFDIIQLKGSSAFVHAEFFIRTSKSSFRVAEIEVTHQKREFGFGSGGNIKVIANAIKDMFLYIAGKL